MISNQNFIETAQNARIKSLEAELELAKKKNAELEDAKLRLENSCSKLCRERDLIHEANENQSKLIKALQSGEIANKSNSELRRRNIELETQLEDLKKKFFEMQCDYQSLIDERYKERPVPRDPQLLETTLTPEQSKKIDQALDSINSYVNRIFSYYPFL